MNKREWKKVIEICIERLQQEARNKVNEYHENYSYFGENPQHDVIVDQIVAHTVQEVLREVRKMVEGKLKAVYEANRKHIEDFEKDSTAYKYNPSEENLAKMKIHEGGNAGFRGGMIEGKMEAYEFLLTQLQANVRDNTSK